MHRWIPKTFALLLTLVFLSGCGNNKDNTYFEDCRYGRPVAILNDTLPGIEEHHFELRSREGVEEVSFESGEELTIIQSGCDSIRQDFQFRLPGEGYHDADREFWVDKAIQEFRSFAGLGPKYIMFSSWAQAIEAKKESIHLAQSEEIQPGFFVRIDRISSSDHAILMVTLSETP